MTYIQKYACQVKQSVVICKFNSTTSIQIKNGILKHVNVKCKKYCKCKKRLQLESSTCFCENSKYLKNIGDISVIACDETVYIMDIASTNMTNTIPTSV